jgi:hypothetical protein
VKALRARRGGGWTAIDITRSARRSRRAGCDAEGSSAESIFLINTAAIFPSTPDGIINDALWAVTLEINVTRTTS